MKHEPSFSILVVKATGRCVAVPVVHVIEIMRPLAIEGLAGAPRFVRGLAVIRGQPAPVVDLGALLTGGAADSAALTREARFVTLRVGNRSVALLVDAVLSFRTVAGEALKALPPLWSEATSPAVGSLATLDRELLFVLEATKLLTSDWREKSDAGGRAG